MALGIVVVAAGVLTEREGEHSGYDYGYEHGFYAGYQRRLDEQLGTVRADFEGGDTGASS